MVSAQVLAQLFAFDPVEGCPEVKEEALFKPKGHL